MFSLVIKQKTNKLYWINAKKSVINNKKSAFENVRNIQTYEKMLLEGNFEDIYFI